MNIGETMGVMLGRLSPPIDNKIQAFPYKTWKDEFKIVNQLGLKSIEWIYEHPNKEYNPICSNDGIKQLIKLSKRYNISINSLVADNFMEDPLCDANNTTLEKSYNLLEFLILQCSTAGIKMVELPLMGKTSIRNKKKRYELITNISDTLNYALEKNIKILFELDLPPQEFLDFILELDNPAVGINYDMGNSAVFGFDQHEEIRTYGKFIENVHIKDGVRGGSTVPLGNGDTDFKMVFSELAKVNYTGDFIFQSARKDLLEINNIESPVTTINNYRNFIQTFMTVV